MGSKLTADTFLFTIAGSSGTPPNGLARFSNSLEPSRSYKLLVSYLHLSYALIFLPTPYLPEKIKNIVEW